MRCQHTSLAIVVTIIVVAVIVDAIIIAITIAVVIAVAITGSSASSPWSVTVDASLHTGPISPPLQLVPVSPVAGCSMKTSHFLFFIFDLYPVPGTHTEKVKEIYFLIKRTWGSLVQKRAV